MTLPDATPRWHSPMALKGTVTDVSRKSPHVHFDIDGKELDGEGDKLGTGTRQPEPAFCQGWSLDSLKIAGPVTLNGYRANNGAKIVRAPKVTLRAR